jgi:hypothetical protein
MNDSRLPWRVRRWTLDSMSPASWPDELRASYVGYVATADELIQATLSYGRCGSRPTVATPRHRTPDQLHEMEILLGRLRVAWAEFQLTEIRGVAPRPI